MMKSTSSLKPHFLSHSGQYGSLTILSTTLCDLKHNVSFDVSPRHNYKEIVTYNVREH